MRIVFYAPFFHPSTGGLEHVSYCWANEISNLGHQVTVITYTSATEAYHYSFEVVRNPSFLQVVRIMKSAQVVIQMNLSLKGLMPYLLIWNRLVVTHHGAYPDTFLGRLKVWLSNRLAVNTANSEFVASYFNKPILVPNPFSSDLFKNKIPLKKRRKDIVFLGRLVSQKGVDLLIEALSILKNLGKYYQTTIIGNGPEKERLEQFVQKSELDELITFPGKKTGEELVGLLNDHKLMVIPSREQEGFGIVALEGLASGCLVIGADSGGIKDAIGECGLLFPVGDVKAISKTIAHILESPETWADYQKHYNQHLANFEKLRSSKLLLSCFQN